MSPCLLSALLVPPSPLLALPSRLAALPSPCLSCLMPLSKLPTLVKWFTVILRAGSSPDLLHGPAMHVTVLVLAVPPIRLARENVASTMMGVTPLL